MPEARPNGIPTFIDNLPAALAPLISLDNWCLWKWAEKNGKWTKVPFQLNGDNARSNDRTTWASYATVVNNVGSYDGIGWFFDSEVSIAAFDIDNCRDPETQLLAPWAAQLVERCASYAEVTISGTGIRIIGFGNGSRLHIKKKVDGTTTCEIYRKLLGRYIVVTGHQIGTGVLVNIDQVIDEVAAELTQLNDGNGAGTGTTATSGDVDLLDQAIRDGFSEAHGPTRSDTLWYACAEMMRRGYARDTIYKIITDPVNGVSSHILDQNNPKRAAERAISRCLGELRFEVEGRGHKKPPTVRNMCIALALMGTTFRYDGFSGRTMIDERDKRLRDIEDDDYAILKNNFELRFQLRMPRETIVDVVKMASHNNEFHPIKDYFASLTWDGAPRLGNWLVKYCGAADTEYHHAVGKILLVAAVRRIRSPGCKFDEMLVLEAPQGTEKSTALSILAIKEDWFSDTLPLNIRGRETIELSKGKWIIEAAELSGMRRADAEHLKAFLSRQYDVGRMAYGRVVMNVPRQFIIIGTTNSDDYLRDFTGNRRYWPVKVGRIDLAQLKQDRDQLWAEACSMEADECLIRLPPELWPRAEGEQVRRVTTDPYFDALHTKLGDFENGRIAAVEVWKALNFLSGAAAQRTPEQNMRVGAAMRNLGWKRDKVSFHRQMVNGYIKGDPPRRLIVVERNGDDVEAHYEDDTVTM